MECSLLYWLFTLSLLVAFLRVGFCLPLRSPESLISSHWLACWALFFKLSFLLSALMFSLNVWLYKWLKMAVSPSFKVIFCFAMLGLQLLFSCVLKFERKLSCSDYIWLCCMMLSCIWLSFILKLKIVGCLMPEVLLSPERCLPLPVFGLVKVEGTINIWHVPFLTLPWVLDCKLEDLVCYRLRFLDLLLINPSWLLD